MQPRRTLQLAVTSITAVSQILDRRNPRHPRPIVIPALVLALASLLAFAVPPASAQINCELHEKGFWRNNPLEWPVDSLQLGTKTYNKQELVTILATRVGGDASVMLAQQLIAALLNIENGTDPAPVDATIDHANSLLGGGGNSSRAQT